MNSKLRAEIKRSFDAPLPRDRERFIDSIAYPKAGLVELFITQLGYIRKRVWILFFGCAAFAVLFTLYVDTEMSIIIGLSSALPIFSVCVVTEIYKSISFNMQETELCCRYNLMRITQIRLIILGTVSFILLILSVILAGQSGHGFINNLIHLGVPFLLVSNLNLAIIARFNSWEALYGCIAVAFLIILVVILYGARLFIDYNITAWFTAFTLLSAVLIYNVLNLINSYEELKWNLQ